jgi:hypothetical protein
VDERSDERSGVAPLQRLELKSKVGITHEEWQYLRATVNEVVLTDPEAREGECTDEDDD